LSKKPLSNGLHFIKTPNTFYLQPRQVAELKTERYERTHHRPDGIRIGIYRYGLRVSIEQNMPENRF